jgi:hypothetical protein
MSNELPYPPIIWLQWHGDGDPSNGDLVPTSEVTWNAYKVWRGDVEYIRADSLAALLQIGQKLRDNLRQADDDEGLAAAWDSLLPNAPSEPPLPPAGQPPRT